MTKKELNRQLLSVCTADVIDYDRAEALLKQGAHPLGKIVSFGCADNLYKEVSGSLFYRRFEQTDGAVAQDLYAVTQLFLRYGMDIAKPAVPYDGDDVLNPLYEFMTPGGEWVIRTLQLLLDHGLRARDAAQCWSNALSDFINVSGLLTTEWEYESYFDFIKKIMLIASYPHILKEDEDLRQVIWYDHNHYDLLNFRNWNNFNFEVDTSRCERHPEVYRSVVTIIEKSSGEKVWKFGVLPQSEQQ